jgi:hypothetical protein
MNLLADARALLQHTEPINCEERRAGAPYLPGLKVPYYLYIGRKRST